MLPSAIVEQWNLILQESESETLRTISTQLTQLYQSSIYVC